MHTKHAAVNNSIIIPHTNWIYFRALVDQAVEQAEAMEIDQANEIENWEIAQTINKWVSVITKVPNHVVFSC